MQRQEARDKIENFDLKTRRTDEGLTIEVEDQTTGDLFTKILSHEMAKIVSNSFLDLETICHILQHYKADTPQETLFITKEGKLVYSQRIMFTGGLGKDLGFTIDLEKKELDAASRLEKSMNKLFAKVSKLEGEKGSETQINELFATFEKNVFEKLQAFESNLNNISERVTQIELKIQEREDNHTDWCFNPDGTFSSQYTLSENNKTAIAKTVGAYPIFAHRPLPFDRVSEFAFQIIQSNLVMVGIAPERAFNNQYVYQDKAAVGYLNSGYLYISGNQKSGFSTYKLGDIVSFKVCLQTGKISIYLSNQPVYEHVIPKNELNEKYYPFLYTNGTIGAGVKFV